MSRVWLFSRLSLVALACGSVLAPGSRAEAQFGRRLFGRGASRSTAPQAPPRTADSYAPGSRGELSDSEFDGGYDADNAEAPSSLPAARTSESRPGLFGRLLGRGRETQPAEIPASPRSISSKSKKKDSELLNSRDLTPIKQRPVEAYGGKTPRQSNSGLSAPKSTTEGIKRREPFSLAPADSSSAGPIVPPAPDEPGEFFERGAADSRDSLELPDEPANLGTARRTAPNESTRRESTRREPVAAPITTRVVTLRPEPQPQREEQELEEDSDVDLDDSDLATDSTTADDAAATDTEEEFESAFDSPYSGRKLDTQSLERRRVTPPSGDQLPRSESRRSIDAPAAKAPRSVSSVRASRTGLMGYCPVMLRDERELVPASAEFSEMFAGKEYQFSSAEAQRTFAANPRLYVPAMGGQDVVQLAEGEAGVPGSLSHATWYRGRLYLFASNETLQQFVATPARFATNP